MNGRTLGVWRAVARARAMRLVLGCLAGLTSVVSAADVETPAVPSEIAADVCVYGGTASGLMAAFAASAGGKTVVVIEPSRWLGGMVGGGIPGKMDCSYPKDIGGLARKFLGMGGTQAACKQWLSMAKERKVRVVFEHRLGTVVTNGNKITSLVLDLAPPEKDGCPAAEATRKGALRVTAGVFIDASYEGDLMARAGVSYVVGRESKDKYGESRGGQRGLRVYPISAYREPDNPASGLLPGLDPDPYQEGAASRHCMGYNFRFQWTSASGPEYVTLAEPSDTQHRTFEMARRAAGLIAAGNMTSRGSVWSLISWPHHNQKHGALLSGGLTGRQSDYPDGDWPERAKIWREFIDHVRILHKVTREGGENLKRCMSGNARGWNLRRSLYPQTDGFPHALYIRLGRRMLGRYVMTQDNLMYKAVAEDSIGLAYYEVDIYPCRLLAHGGKVAAEGDVYQRVSPGPFPISYRSLTPKKEECTNLLVPVCISASHVALSVIRMEPSFMIMGESAGIAAVRALEEKTAVQDINMEAYRTALLAAGQKLEWSGEGYGNFGKVYQPRFEQKNGLPIR